VDTPGLHRPRTALGERLNRLVAGSLAEADAALFVLDATQRIGPGDRLIAERLADAETRAVVVVNKVDAADRDAVAVQLTEAGAWDFDAYVPVSALLADNLAPIVAELGEILEEGPAYFPPGMVSDQPERVLIGELIREKLLARLRDELPHSLAVVIEDIEEQDNGVVRIDARLVVERESQKGIVIGRGGSLIKEAATEARLEIESLLGARVFLDARVRVEKDWQQRPGAIERLGM
jgi:GTP-binding protein Era